MGKIMKSSGFQTVGQKQIVFVQQIKQADRQKDGVHQAMQGDQFVRLFPPPTHKSNQEENQTDR